MTISRRELLGAAGALYGSLILPARAQNWPDRPIKILLGYATGGSTDATARILGRPLEKRLGQPVVVDYKPGAGATLSSWLAPSPWTRAGWPEFP